MSRITLLGRDGDGDWCAWIALEDGDPTEMHESFVIGSGETRAAAIEAAIADLNGCIADLRVLADADAQAENRT